MAPTTAPSADDLAALHRDWEHVHQRLRVREQELSTAIASYARGEGPRPEAMISEVEGLRAECSVRFKSLMDAVRSQSESRP